MINLSQIGHEVKEAIRQETALTLVPLENNLLDLVVILCGCARACGNQKEIRAKAFRTIVVAGETIDLVPVSEKDIGPAVMKKLKSPADVIKKT